MWVLHNVVLSLLLKLFSQYQLCQLRIEHQHYGLLLYPSSKLKSSLMIGTEQVSKTLVFSPPMMSVIAWEEFCIFVHHKRFQSYNVHISCYFSHHIYTYLIKAHLCNSLSHFKLTSCKNNGGNGMWITGDRNRHLMPYLDSSFLYSTGFYITAHDPKWKQEGQSDGSRMFYQKQLKILKWPWLTNVGGLYRDCTNICLFCRAAINTLHSKQQKKYMAIQHTSMQSQSRFHTHPPNKAATHGLSSCKMRSH